jgi:hypothetical protein
VRLFNSTRRPRFLNHILPGIGNLGGPMALNLIIDSLPFETSQIDDRSRCSDIERRYDMAVFGELAGHDLW